MERRDFKTLRGFQTLYILKTSVTTLQSCDDTPNIPELNV